MHYRVRNSDGELAFPGISQLAAAYEQGLVEPDDEVSVDEGPWRKAGVLPELKAIRAAPRKRAPGTQLWYRVAFALVALGLFFLFIRPGRITTVIVAVVLTNAIIWYQMKQTRRRRR